MGFDPNDPQLQKFLKSLMRTFINSAIFRLVGRMGTMWLVIMLVLGVGLMIGMGWYK